MIRSETTFGIKGHWIKCHCVTVSLARLIKVYVSYVYNTARTAERFSDIFHTQSCQKNKC